MRKIKKLLSSPIEGDLEIALILWERKKTYFKFLLILEWIVSSFLLPITVVNFLVNLSRGKGRWMSIAEFKLYLERRDMRYLGLEMFYNEEGVIDVLMSPIGYIYLWIFKGYKK